MHVVAVAGCKRGSQNPASFHAESTSACANVGGRSKLSPNLIHQYTYGLMPSVYNATSLHNGATIQADTPAALDNLWGGVNKSPHGVLVCSPRTPRHKIGKRGIRFWHQMRASLNSSLLHGTSRKLIPSTAAKLALTLLACYALWSIILPVRVNGFLPVPTGYPRDNLRYAL